MGKDFLQQGDMAKAALNMMTRTSAGDFMKDNIAMTAVDTGWINDENPLEKAARTAERHGFATPLDEIDAAARILDPIFAPILVGQNNSLGTCSPSYGCLLKITILWNGNEHHYFIFSLSLFMMKFTM